MIVYAECTFFIPMASSLKEKRSILKRMIDRTKNSYNVSIAEFDHQDLWQRTTIAVVATSSSKDVAEQEIRQTIRFLESNPEWELSEQILEYY